MFWVAGEWVGRRANPVPRLYVVPTPIGNLEDITVRALRVLREVHLVLAEDTRHTRKLLTHYEISNRLLSYHQHNKLTRLEEILGILRQHDVALVSNAGMPAIADPGFELIAAAIEQGIEIDVLPGASAVLAAVVAAAIPAPGFVFGSFLPRRQGARRRYLAEMSGLPFTLVYYEAPHRLEDALRDILAVLGDRVMVLARELTKMHQEIARGTAGSLLAKFAGETVRGECTLVIAGAEPASLLDALAAARQDLERRQRCGEDRRNALAAVAVAYPVGKNALYRMWLELEGEEE